MLNLNRLPNLEEISAELINFVSPFEPLMRIEEQYINRTIKHITLKRQEVFPKWLKKGVVHPYTDFFQRLETVTVLQPEVVTHQRDNFGDNIQIRWHS